MEIEICRLVFLQHTNGNSWWEARQQGSGQETVILKGNVYIDEYWKRGNTSWGAFQLSFGIININEEIARSNEQRKAANINLVAQLASSGWEPATFDDKGLVATLKRVKPGSESGNAEHSQPTSFQRSQHELRPDELLKQLAVLRDAGILTQDEFDAKKAEILKRM